ncbi:ester cyclase [Halomonas beimenensis]|uniref:Ester cyclase n=1 Tax=Halomonas beimenensis TaxID=475662 RepID=A0A291P3J2_9GAMM|nr:ester cyclase [Halomonas beimenensis]ATJ81439.1 hypothetical protein BEI_0452 [Halomonas beimenensis]
MTERNKRLVREFIDAANGKDWERCGAMLAPGFVRHSSTHGQADIDTRERLLKYLRAESETFPDGRETINFLVAEEDKVVVHSRCQGTQQGPMGSLPPSGRILSADLISIYRLADGRIAEVWTEWDSLTGLIQLGHLEPVGLWKPDDRG